MWVIILALFLMELNFQLSTSLSLVAKVVGEFEIYSPQIILIEFGQENSNPQFTQPRVRLGGSVFNQSLLNISFSTLVRRIWRQNLQLILMDYNNYAGRNTFYPVTTLRHSLWWAK